VAQSDADLVKAALAGDKESLGTLIKRHWQTAIFLAARVLDSPELARDAAQEAAIAAMTGLDKLRSPDRFGAWFCGITLNVARRWRRKLGAELPGPPPEQATAEPGPAEAAELAEVAGLVREAIALLADGQAEAVRLFYLQGLSHREVAAELGISLGAVKARLHQARAALAPRLAESLAKERTEAMTTASETHFVSANITEIRRSHGDEEHGHHIMVLTEADGDRWLPIWIGRAEATALALSLEAAEMPRPLTYQLAADLVTAGGATITEVRITRLEAPVFYAEVVVTGPAGTREVDARPSDAVNLAVTAGVPIKVDSELFELNQVQRDTDLEACPVVTADMAAKATARVREALTEP